MSCTPVIHNIFVPGLNDIRVSKSGIQDALLSGIHDTQYLYLVSMHEHYFYLLSVIHTA